MTAATTEQLNTEIWNRAVADKLINDRIAAVEEAVAGVTREAAQALGRIDEIGTLEVGKWCDLAIWNVDRLAELPYHMGLNPLYARVWRGQ